MDINIGKILIQPKDNWNATTPYEYLNLVRYNKNLYICKSVTGAPVGTLPTNTSYYMHITADGIDAQGPEGTTSLATALTLDEITEIFGSFAGPEGTTSLATALTLDEITAIFSSSAPAP